LYNEAKLRALIDPLNAAAGESWANSGLYIAAWRVYILFSAIRSPSKSKIDSSRSSIYRKVMSGEFAKVKHLEFLEAKLRNGAE